VLGLGTLGEFPLGGGPTRTPVGSANLSWWAPYNEPVRYLRDPRANIALINQFFTTDIIPVVPFPRWFWSLSEPVRQKPFSPAAVYPNFFYQPSPSPFAATGWYDWLSEPVRIRPLLLPDDQPFIFEQLPQPVFLEWFANLSEPVRVKPRLLTGLNMDLGRASFIPLSFKASLNTTEQGDIFLAVLRQYNRARRALVSIFRKK
jgi:hypothetical protein